MNSTFDSLRSSCAEFLGSVLANKSRHVLFMKVARTGFEVEAFVIETLETMGHAPQLLVQPFVDELSATNGVRVVVVDDLNAREDLVTALTQSTAKTVVLIETWAPKTPEALALRKSSLFFESVEAPTGETKRLQKMLSKRPKKEVPDTENLSLSWKWGEGDARIIELSRKMRRAVKTLALTELGGDETAVCDPLTARLWSRLPKVESVTLNSSRPLFNRIASKSLTHLHLIRTPIGQTHWGLELPELTSLTLKPDYDADCDDEVLAPLWKVKLPKLETLTLEGLLFTLEGCFLDRPEVKGFIGSLSRLSFPYRMLLEDFKDDPQIPEQALLRNVSNLKHLSALVITDGESHEGQFESVRALLPNLEFTARAGQT